MNQITIVRVAMGITIPKCWFQYDETARLIVVVSKYVNKNEMLLN
jgi:hypothetical protein